MKSDRVSYNYQANKTMRVSVHRKSISKSWNVYTHHTHYKINKLKKIFHTNSPTELQTHPSPLYYPKPVHSLTASYTWVQRSSKYLEVTSKF